MCTNMKFDVLVEFSIKYLLTEVGMTVAKVSYFDCKLALFDAAV